MPAGKFITKIKSYVFSSEAARIGFLVFLGLFMILALLPFLFNNSALKFQISQKVSEIYGADFAISGDVSVSFLPTPTITMKDVWLRNFRVKSEKNSPDKIYNLHAEKAQIKLTVFKFDQDSPIRKIIFTKAALQAYYENSNAKIAEDLLGKKLLEIEQEPSENNVKKGSGITQKLFSIAEFKGFDLKAKSLPMIEIVGGEVISYDKFGRKSEINSINLRAKLGLENISAKGGFISENVLSNFEAKIKFNSGAKESDSFFALHSPVAEISVKGVFSSENLGIFASDFRGKIEAEISEFKTFYQSYIGGQSAISQKLKLNSKPIKISADLASKDKEIAVKNILINSSIISGKGEVDLSLARDVLEIDIGLVLGNLDLDAFLSTEAVALNSSYTEQDFLSPNLDQLSADNKMEVSSIIELQEGEKEGDSEAINSIKNLDLTAEIQVENIKLFDGQIKDASLYATVAKGGQIMVMPLILRIPGDGVFRVSGVLDSSTILPKFVGKFDAQGKSLGKVLSWLKIESQNLKFDNLRGYGAYSDIFLRPNFTKFSNFYLNLSDDNSEFLGDLTINNSDKSAFIQSRFRASKFDIDEYFLTSNQNAYFSSGRLIKKLLWLNNISSNAQFDLNFEKLIYRGEEFKNPSMKLSFGRGYVRLEDLRLNSDMTDLKADMIVDISNKDPKFTMNVEANNFHYESEKDPEEFYGQHSKKLNFVDRFFNLPSLEGFGGLIDLSFNNLRLDDSDIKNLKLSGNLLDGDIRNANLSADLCGGNLSYKGLVGIGVNKVFNGNISANNVDLKDFLSKFLDIKNISGVANIAANITASAATRREFKESVTSEIKFTANAPMVLGYGLDNLVSKMFAPKGHEQELSNPEQILFDPKSSTMFKQASGLVNIGGNGMAKIRADVSGLAINAILTAEANIVKNSMEGLFNVIFLTGSRENQIPINIASNISGSINDLRQVTNMDQARQYLGLKNLANKTQQPEQEEVTQPQEVDNQQEKSQILQPVSAQ